MIFRFAALALAATSLPLAAQEAGPAPFPEFEAKRIGPPKAGATRRITVQITEPPPKPAAPRATAPQTRGGAALAVGRYSWFWDQIAPEIKDAGPARLEPALAAISGSGAVESPRLQGLQDIARAQGRRILAASAGTGVSPALALAVIAVESAGRGDAQSGAGAQGLMQLMPATAARFGVADPWAPEQNIAGGIRYLDWLLKEFAGDPILALAGYNAGEGAVRDHRGVPPYAETRDYVPKVLAAFQVAKGLCLTPPQLISDGCVFRTME